MGCKSGHLLAHSWWTHGCRAGSRVEATSTQLFFRRRRFLLRRSLRCFVFFVFLLLLTFLFLFFLQLAIGSYGFLFPALFFLLFFFFRLHGILLQLLIIIIIILLLRLLLLCISINGGFVRLCRRFFDGNIHL